MKFLIIFCLLSFNVLARPNPQKTLTEIANDTYNDLGDLDPSTGAQFVTLTATDLGIAEIPQNMKEGVHTDFTVTNILDSGYTDLITLSNDVKKMSVTHNGGGTFILRKNSTDLGFIAPGESSYVEFTCAAGDIVRIKSESGTVSTGDLFLNFFGD